MPRRIHLNAFDMACVGHIQQGLWTHPRDQSTRYTELDYWTGYARRLEAGLFDGIFFADVVGVYDVLGGSADAAVRHAVQVPVNDPMLLIPAMASVTKHLGFGVTAKMAHDDRYDMADEFMAVVRALWEGSWDDGAVVRDRATGVYADPAKVRRIHHDGRQYKLHAMQLAEPSPQRTPVLYQAGASARGTRFAATHAECVFLNGQAKPEAVRKQVDALRAEAVAQGRTRDAIKVFLGATIITGRTDAEAQEKFEDYQRHASSEAALVHAAASLGIDFAKYDIDEPVATGGSNAITSNVDAMTRAAGPQWTRRKLLEQIVLGSRQKPWIGSGATIARMLVDWAEQGDVDGYNLSRTVVPECFDDVIAHVVPHLQELGAYKTSYDEGTLRHKLFGTDRLPWIAPSPAGGGGVG
jgi:alkanesulfonate monooxygenase SsuD/methylene tetrahydromethanopterin reductase-like flavin-dependent oxidoreductase (luciferase family)